MELVKSNNQGELLALEIGLHALATVNDKTKKGGGIRAYAEEIGKGEDALKQWTSAATERAKGTKGQLKGSDSSGSTQMEPPEKDTPSLAELGIPKKVSTKSQKLASLP